MYLHTNRRMFPGIVISIAGLESDSKYIVTVEVNPADNHRYKYLNSKWVVVGKADTHSEEMVKYVHPDSPSSGRHWMANKVSFKKIKITNNRSNRRGNVSNKGAVTNGRPLIVFISWFFCASAYMCLVLVT